MMRVLKESIHFPYLTNTHTHTSADSQEEIKQTAPFSKYLTTIYKK